MSELSFGKLIVPALLTTGAVFTALSAPVVMFAETPLNISQGKSQLYDGTVRDAALPYLMLAAATSVGLGISGVAMVGWRKSSKRVEALSDVIDSQQQRRLDREAHLKASLASESYLVKSGLDFFLEDGELTPFVPERLPVAQPVLQAALPPQSQESRDMMTQLAWLDGEDVALPSVLDDLRSVADHRPQVVEPIARPLPLSLPIARPLPPSLPRSPQAAPLTAAQGFHGFARGNEARQSQSASGQMVAQDQMTIARIQSLQTQLQAIVTQIESLQADLPTHPSAMQIVEEVPLAQSGLVQQEFKPQSQVELNRSEHVQSIHRVAS
jgi:hypothetical protein